MRVGSVPSALLNGTTLTLAAFVRIRSIGPQGGVISKWNGGAGNSEYTLNVDGSGRVSGSIYDGATRTATGVSVLPIGIWKPIAFRMDGTALTVWNSGIQDGTGTAVGSITNTAGSLHFGDFIGLFPGAMAELAMWNVALSDSDIAALANGTSPLDVATKPRGYWPLCGDLLPEPDFASGAAASAESGTILKTGHPVPSVCVQGTQGIETQIGYGR